MPDAWETVPTRLANSVVSAAEGAIGVQIDRLVGVAASTLVGIFLGTDRDRDRQEMREYYDRVQKIVEDSGLPRDQYELQATLPHPPIWASPQERVKRDIRDANILIEQSIRTLEEAHDKTLCSVCKKDIEEAIVAVREKTDGVRDASEKALAIRDLKDRGVLPPEATWDALPNDARLVVINAIRAEKGLPIMETYHGDEADDTTKTKRGPNKGRQTPRGSRGGAKKTGGKTSKRR